MSSNKEHKSQAVFVNIYDMYTVNNYVSAMGVGIYHCGIEVYGVEFGYGGHPFPFSGIFEMTPRDNEELGESFRFKEAIEIGSTDFTRKEIEQIVKLMGREFRGIDYHLINKNCNSFSSQFSKTICGTDIPAWVNRLAYLSTFVPFIERMIPKEWISPIAVQHSVEEHMREGVADDAPGHVTNSNSNSSLSKSTTSLLDRPSSATSTTINTNTTSSTFNLRAGNLWSNICESLTGTTTTTTSTTNGGNKPPS